MERVDNYFYSNADFFVQPNYFNTLCLTFGKALAGWFLSS